MAERIYPIASGKKYDLRVAETLTALDSHDLTLMATGLWHAVYQICQTNAERCLLLMITNGAPDIDHPDAVRVAFFYSATESDGNTRLGIV